MIYRNKYIPSPAPIIKKNYLDHNKCVAPLGHGPDQTGSGPELSPKHTPSDSFCWEMLFKYGLPVPLWRRQASFTVHMFAI